MGLAGRDAGAHRQERPRAIQRLDLALFVHRQDDGAVGRTEIQPDDVAHLLDKLRVRRQLERVEAMRLQPERLPDARDRGLRQSGHLGQAARRPLRRVRRRAFERAGNHVDNPIVGRFARRARPRLVRQPRQAAHAKPFAPLAHAVTRHADSLGHRPIREPVRAGQHDPRPQRQPLRRRRSAGPLLQRAAFVLSQQHRLVVAFSRHAAQRTRATAEVQDFF